jgi:alpha/beta hydrolase family protein
LSDKYTVINIDIRGHGQSRPCDTFSIKEATSDLRNILLAEKCEKAILIGLSMGGGYRSRVCFCLWWSFGIYDYWINADIFVVLLEMGKNFVKPFGRYDETVSLDFYEE